MFTLNDLQNRIEKRISDYIEFDVKDLFAVSDYITIYGGAVRDSLAKKEIHDVDILCMPTSAEKLRKYLRDVHGYTSLDLFDQDTLNMYHGISIISEPWTLMNKNRKIIQIIRPTWKSQPYKHTDPVNSIFDDYKFAYHDLIKNVDISCCGVFLENYSNKVTLREACKDAIIHCLSQTFIINEWSQLYNRNRTLAREHKLTSRGWSDLNKTGYFSTLSKIEAKKRERLAKICTLEFKPEYDYKIWTEEEYSTRITPTYDDGLPF